MLETCSWAITLCTSVTENQEHFSFQQVQICSFAPLISRLVGDIMLRKGVVTFWTPCTWSSQHKFMSPAIKHMHGQKYRLWYTFTYMCKFKLYHGSFLVVFNDLHLHQQLNEIWIIFTRTPPRKSAKLFSSKLYHAIHFFCTPSTLGATQFAQQTLARLL